jgi:hypothetical protein
VEPAVEEEVPENGWEDFLFLFLNRNELSEYSLGTNYLYYYDFFSNSRRLLVSDSLLLEALVVSDSLMILVLLL